MAKKKTKSDDDSSLVEVIQPANNADSSALPDAFQLFEPSCKVILNNFREFAWLLGLPFILSVLLAVDQLSVQTGANHTATVNGAFLSLSALTVIVALLVAPATIVLEFACVRLQSMTAGEAFRKGLHYFWKFVGLSIVISILLVVSFCLLIVPFFIVLPRILLSTYFLIDQDLSIFDSIRASNEAYKKHHSIWGIIGVNVLIYIPSIIPVIGRIVTTSLGYLYQPAYVLRYEQIKLLDVGKKPRTPFETKLKP